MLLPDHPDTLHIAQSSLTLSLKKWGYDLLVIDKVGQDASHRLNSDSREARMKDVLRVYQKEVAGIYDQIVLIGIGEGGYLIPALRNTLQSATAIAINVNPYSQLAAYEQWIGQDSLSPRQWQIIYRKNLIDTVELAKKIHDVKNLPPTNYVLPPNLNRQWMSYYQHPLYHDLYGSLLPLYWINFEKYPTLSDAHQKEAERYAASAAAKYISIPAKGNLNDEEQMGLLLENLKSILSPTAK